MRILTITNLYPPDVIGGYEIGCRQMVEALRRRGHTVEVVTSTPRWPVPAMAGVERSLRATEWYTRGERGQVDAGVARVMDVQARGVMAGNVQVITEAIARVCPDVVYLWNVMHIGALGVTAALAHLQVPVLWHLMDDVPRAMVTQAEKPPATAVAQLLSHRMRASYVACSTRLVDEIAAAGYDFDGRLSILPNWVEQPRERARAWYPDAAPGLRVIAAGQLNPNKGIDLILQAVKMLLDSGRSGFTIDLIGDDLNDRYHRLILEDGLTQHVRLRGMLEHASLVEEFWNYDMFLFPTWRREPFGFAPLEAAARGCVPVISNDCGLAEWLVDSVHAIKIERSAPAVAAALGAALDGRCDLPGIGRRAQRMARTDLSVDRIAPEVERLMGVAQDLPARRPGSADQAYVLARLAERLALTWAERPT
ncbi:MAG: glycosyltransferase family 4 protein [Solirubrobacteraceae bacterium]